MTGSLTADRLDRLFAAIDAKDTEAFLSYLTKDAVFRFGSAPESSGHDAIRDGVNGFFASIAGSRHAIRKVINSDSTLVCEAEVTYKRQNGTEITLPFTNVFELDGELISHYKIYIDIAPLYAE
jgi:ketosteroid isomerase-like protein